MPAAVAINDDSTNEASLKPNGRKPSTSARRSFSLMASQTAPVCDLVASHTTAYTTTRNTSASQYRLRVLATPTSISGSRLVDITSPVSPLVRLWGLSSIR